MGQTIAYKPAAQHKRMMTTETTFKGGMKFVNSQLPEGYVKTLVNFDIKNDGECITPRGGIVPITDVLASSTATYATNTVHHTGNMYVQTADESNALICGYMLFGNTTLHSRFTLKGSKLIIEYNDEYFTAEYDSTIKDAVPDSCLLNETVALSEIHDMTLPETYRANVGACASIEANTYVMVFESVTKSYLGCLSVWFNEDMTGIKWCVNRVQAEEVQPTQAINYGYNMLKDEPYKFVNTTTATGAIVLTGVLPYDKEDNLILSARPGSEITFRLYYQYPAADVTAEKYLVQWEFQDLDSDANNYVAQKVRKSPVYVPGADITYTCTPTFKNFAVIVKIYRATDIKDSDAHWADDAYLQELAGADDMLQPDQVITLSSYYLTSDSTSSTMNMSPTKYDLGTATGMCSWNQRLVLWGVDNAKSTLFVSDINKPEYVPFPNNSEVFNQDIVGCVPYMSDLLIFTKNALYRASFDDTGINYIVTCIQERLNMTEADICTLLTVQNMIYFKSNNYFYMVVPSYSSAQQGVSLQMAPISKSIEYLLDNFEDSVHTILNDVYNIDTINGANAANIVLTDYCDYLDGNKVRNVYKFLVVGTYTDADDKVVERYRRYVDVVLNYDTVQRSWTIYVYDSTQYRVGMYKPTVTGKALMYYIWDDVGSNTDIKLVTFSSSTAYDGQPINADAEALFRNYQYLETGYRMHSEDVKKRFREVQFSINSLTDHKLKFYTGFTVDDDERKSLYTHKVTQCTDKNDSAYGTIFIERVLDEEACGRSLTMLDTEWVLDTSQFPELTVTKVRYKVSGKGYNSNVKILSTNENMYELLSIGWVYRVMYAR